MLFRQVSVCTDPAISQPGRSYAAVLWGVFVLGGPPSGSQWPLRRLSMKIQKKKTVTEKVYHEETYKIKTYTYSQTGTGTLT